MKCRILVIEDGSSEFLGLGTESGQVIDLIKLSKGVLASHYQIRDEQKGEILIEDITDF